ncbi:hypothetical protein Purlil1_11497 [Purpureocillium lilacinum]|uniref:C2H2-type domain-containing protein n=1 Tax=Purpureocillium lilacinum TaxID=33203 RepID=A0ABR0BJQ5_PURLI|nr:hypothetical protein Purlil1_11497 [Purpureocillium lilacinum]
MNSFGSYSFNYSGPAMQRGPDLLESNQTSRVVGSEDETEPLRSDRGQPAALPAEVISTKNDMTPTQYADRPFHCSRCEWKFKRHTTLKRHYMTLSRYRTEAVPVQILLKRLQEE